MNQLTTSFRINYDCSCTGEGYDREAVFHYAEQVAAGFRQPMPPHWPQKVRALIADCWHQVCWLCHALRRRCFIYSGPGR